MDRSAERLSQPMPEHEDALEAFNQACSQLFDETNLQRIPVLDAHSLFQADGQAAIVEFLEQFEALRLENGLDRKQLVSGVSEHEQLVFGGMLQLAAAPPERVWAYHRILNPTDQVAQSTARTNVHQNSLDVLLQPWNAADVKASFATLLRLGHLHPLATASSLSQLSPAVQRDLKTLDQYIAAVRQLENGEQPTQNLGIPQDDPHGILSEFLAEIAMAAPTVETIQQVYQAAHEVFGLDPIDELDTQLEIAQQVEHRSAPLVLLQKIAGASRFEQIQQFVTLEPNTLQRLIQERPNELFTVLTRNVLAWRANLTTVEPNPAQFVLGHLAAAEQQRLNRDDLLLEQFVLALFQQNLPSLMQHGDALYEISKLMMLMKSQPAFVAEPVVAWSGN